MATSHAIAAAAQYAASEAPVFPLEVATHFDLPSANIAETATEANRSLYDPVGLIDSSLKNSWGKPASGPMRRERTSGVFPSPIEI
jgi:hypothetical protein